MELEKYESIPILYHMNISSRVNKLNGVHLLKNTTSEIKIINIYLCTNNNYRN